MGDIFSNLGLGFGVVFQLVQWTPAFLGGASIPIPVNILLCLIGALVGTLVGVLPGIGTIATVAGGRADHAGRHLLRCAVWRLDHVDPGQHSR
jgi:hypothetical protein